MSWEEIQEQEEAENMQLVDEKLPLVYHQYRHVFSKKDGNQLPPHRPGIDHKIKLIT